MSPDARPRRRPLPDLPGWLRQAALGAMLAPALGMSLGVLPAAAQGATVVNGTYSAQSSMIQLRPRFSPRRDGSLSVDLRISADSTRQLRCPAASWQDLCSVLARDDDGRIALQGDMRRLREGVYFGGLTLLGTSLPPVPVGLTRDATGTPVLAAIDGNRTAAAWPLRPDEAGLLPPLDATGDWYAMPPWGTLRFEGDGVEGGATGGTLHVHALGPCGEGGALAPLCEGAVAEGGLLELGMVGNRGPNDPDGRYGLAVGTEAPVAAGTRMTLQREPNSITLAVGGAARPIEMRRGPLAIPGGTGAGLSGRWSHEAPGRRMLLEIAEGRATLRARYDDACPHDVRTLHSICTLSTKDQVTWVGGGRLRTGSGEARAVLVDDDPNYDMSDLPVAMARVGERVRMVVPGEWRVPPLNRAEGWTLTFAPQNGPHPLDDPAAAQTADANTTDGAANSKETVLDALTDFMREQGVAPSSGGPGGGGPGGGGSGGGTTVANANTPDPTASDPVAPNSITPNNGTPGSGTPGNIPSNNGAQASAGAGEPDIAFALDRPDYDLIDFPEGSRIDLATRQVILPGLDDGRPACGDALKAQLCALALGRAPDGPPLGLDIEEGAEADGGLPRYGVVRALGNRFVAVVHLSPDGLVLDLYAPDGTISSSRLGARGGTEGGQTTDTALAGGIMVRRVDDGRALGVLTVTDGGATLRLDEGTCDAGAPCEAAGHELTLRDRAAGPERIDALFLAPGFASILRVDLDLAAGTGTFVPRLGEPTLALTLAGEG